MRRIAQEPGSRRNTLRGEHRRPHFVDTDHPPGGLLEEPASVPSTSVALTTTARRPFVVRPSPEALLDVAIAAAAFAGSLALLAHGGLNVPGTGSDVGESRSLDLLGFVLTACSTLPLFAWRRFPLGVFEATAAASVVLVGLGYPLDLMLGPTAALYLLAASRGRHVSWTPRTTLTVAGLLVAYLGAAAADQGSFPYSELLHSGLAWAVAWFAGERTRLRRAHITELKERARRTEREAERERQLAAAEERARIARDLHDSAGHAISVIAVRAGAARLRHHQDPDRSLRALEAIENLARQTAHEIDQIVGSLRRDDPANGAIAAPSGLASLDTLITRHRAAGLEVTVHSSGTPHTPSGAADQAAYRILQEALTNAVRHGDGSAHIELEFAGTAVELTVTNPVPAFGAPRSSGGHGLIGMRERATLLGGDLDAAGANGTFRVHARVPYGDDRS
jgi:signal transduction histidine kinase